MSIQGSRYRSLTNQLVHARQIEEKERLGIEYIQGDAAAVIETLPESSFDLVTACVSLVDMPDPDASYAVPIVFSETAAIWYSPTPTQ